MVFIAILVTATSGTLLFRPQLYRDAGVVIWLIMPLLLVGFGVASGQTRRMVSGGGSRPHPSTGGLGRLLGLSVLMVAVATVGLWIELYVSTLRIRNNPGETLLHLVGWLHMAAATMVIALSGALVLGFLWFFLEALLRRQELAAVANLLEDS
jgi:hypothetical protein